MKSSRVFLNRPDIDTICVYGLRTRRRVYIPPGKPQMVGVKDKKQKRVWIVSCDRGRAIEGNREARDETEYDNLSRLRLFKAKEDYLMGINFSRVLTP